MKIKFTLNDQVIEAEPGQTVMDAATDAGIPIPSICHHRSLVPEGSCRLCGVEVEGRRGEIRLLHAAGGRRHGGAQRDARDQGDPAPGSLRCCCGTTTMRATTRDDPETEFMYWVRRSGLPIPADAQPRYPINSDPNPFVWVDMNKCIQCTRCVRACDEVQGRFVLGYGRPRPRPANRGGHGHDHARGALRIVWRLRGLLPHGRPGQQDVRRAGQARQDRHHHLRLLRRGLPLRLHVKDGEIIRVVSNPTRARERDGAVREGSLRLRLRPPSGSSDDAARTPVPARGHAPARRVAATGSKPTGRRRSTWSRRKLVRIKQRVRRRCDRIAVVGQVHERGKLSGAEVRAPGDRHAQRRPLRAAVPCLDRRRPGDVLRLRRHEQHLRRHLPAMPRPS